MCYRISLFLFCLGFVVSTAFAQDPVLPATNLGLANMGDGLSPGPGLYYINYLQAYQSDRLRNSMGTIIKGAPTINSFLSMNQFIYESKIRLAAGNLGFTLLLPLVKISAQATGKAPSVNPNILGGLITGSFVQWSGKKLFNLPYNHRAEIDVSTPIGSYNRAYDINPLANHFTLSAYYTFTLSLGSRLEISSRNQLNYNFAAIDTKAEAGAFYNSNFSFGYSPLKSLQLAFVGYYLKQLNQDAYEGNHHYYQDLYGIVDTREQVLGIGPGISFFSRNGLAAEAKVFFEHAALNRAEGVRCTLKIAYTL